MAKADALRLAFTREDPLDNKTLPLPEGDDGPEEVVAFLRGYLAGSGAGWM